MYSLLLIALSISTDVVFPDWTKDPIGCPNDLFAQIGSEGMERYEISIERDGRMIVRHVRVLTQLIPNDYNAILPIALAWDPTHMATPQIRTRCSGEDPTPTQLAQHPLFESERETTAIQVLEAMPDWSETLVVETTRIWNRPAKDEVYSGIFELHAAWNEIILKVPTMSLPLIRHGGLTRQPDVTEADSTILHFRAHNVDEAWFQFSYASDWPSQAKHYTDMLEKHLYSSDTLEVPANLIAKGDNRKSALLLTQWLGKKIASVNTDLTAIPTDPAITLRRKAGSTADKALLLCALLRKAGIEAKLALIAPRSPRPYLEAYKVAVFLPQEKVWINPAFPFQGTAALPFEDLGQKALILEATALTQVTTPDPDTYDGKVTYQMRHDLRDLDEPTFQSLTRYSGKVADDERQILIFLSPAWLDEFDMAHDFNKKTDQFDNPLFKEEGPEELHPCHGPTTASLSIKEHYFEEDFWNRQETECREYKTVDEFLIPPGYKLVTPVKEGTFETKAGKYERNLTWEPERLIITSSFFPSRRIWGKAQAQQAAKQLQALQQQLGGELTLEFHPEPGHKPQGRAFKPLWLLVGLLLLGLLTFGYWRARSTPS